MLTKEQENQAKVVVDHVGDDFMISALLLGMREGVDPAVLNAFGIAAVTSLLNSGKIMLRREGE